jgi:hypothetical protein
MSSTLNGRALRTVDAKTANYTVIADTDNGKTFTNEGAAGAITFALPAATVGQWFRFKVKVAQELRIDPNGTQTIALPSTGAQGAAGKYLTADAVGEGVELECVKAGVWEANYYTGTWTAEA